MTGTSRAGVAVAVVTDSPFPEPRISTAVEAVPSTAVSGSFVSLEAGTLTSATGSFSKNKQTNNKTKQRHYVVTDTLQIESQLNKQTNKVGNEDCTCVGI